MKIKQIGIDELIPYHNNPRKNQAVNKVASSINEYGFQQPIVVDKNMIVIVGHTRLLGAKKLGLKQVPVYIADLSDSKAKAYRIADNRLNEDSIWDFDLLDLEVKGLLEDNYNIDLLGFDSVELDKFLKNDEKYLTDEDEVPEPPKEPKAKLGDIYKLGEHKLICGDSVIEENLKNLLENKKADLVFTDPPYNADYKSRGKNELLRKGIKNDNMSNDDFQIFAENIFKAIKENTYKGSSMYICCNWKDSYPRFYFIAEKNNINVSNCIVWNKESAGMGWNDYRYQFEFILYGFEKTQKHNFYGDRKNTDIWSLKRDSRNTYAHPTQKPVELIERAIINSSLQEQTVLDLFLGSGSTLIACEKTKRKCLGFELDPKYVDVIIQRWENFTGKKAKLLNG
tara:strand:+ start:338 stop:1528 length:1191 start_codon:yes stop_codon:yes gene_type:complete